MNIDRVRHVLNVIMILCILIFGGLMGIVLITDTSLVSKTIALPFAFLFLFIITLITSGRIQERPKKTNAYLREWLMICTISTIICALAVTFA